MQPPPTPRHSIEQWMVGIAVLASLLAVPRLVNSPETAFMASVVGFLTALVLFSGLVEWILALPCPACSRRTLRPNARHPSYFRCSACRARFKRFGRGPWLDASGPDDAVRYRRSKEYGTWKGYAPPEDLDGSSSGQLLRRKRSRDLLVVVKRCPPRARPGWPLEEAERKVRKFLNRVKNMDDLEG